MGGEDDGWVKKKGVAEMEEYIRSSAPNGVVLNGLLVWIDIQKKTTPENIWKAQALSKCSKEDITEAKNALLEVGDELVIGKIEKRIGGKKGNNSWR